MLDFINPIQWFASIPPEWAVFWTSMLPVTEIRASIPIGIEYYGLPIWKVFIIALMGGIIPAIFLLLFLPKLNTWIQKNKFFGKIFNKHLKKAEKKFSGKYSKYGALALIIFVGIPLPFTGAWTGSLASFVFNIPFKKSLPLIFAGVVLAATLITLITLFAGGTIRVLFGL